MEDTNNELASLAIMAGQIDGDQAAAGPEAVIAQAEADQAIAMADGNATQVAMILGLAVPILGQMFPSIIEVYTPEAQAAVAGTVGPVLSKYGVDLGDMGSKWGPEIACVVVCGPIAMATYKGINADLAAAAAKNKQAPKAVASNSQQAPAGPPPVQSLGTPDFSDVGVFPAMPA